MKKIICIRCGIKRGRRQCEKEGGKYICGDCCTDEQLKADCSKNCIHYGKINEKGLSAYINALSESENPDGVVKLFDVYKDSADEFFKRRGLNGRYKLNYLYGWYFFIKRDFDKAVELMEKVAADDSAGQLQVNMARLVLARAYLMKKDIKRALDNALSVDETYAKDKRFIIENAYLAGGRMYELLDMLNSIENHGVYENYMLLQCSLVLKKDEGEEILAIVDDLINSGFFTNNIYENARLVAIKIKLLFKKLKMKEAYEVFEQNEKLILGTLNDVDDCREASILAAFFIYTVDKYKALKIYNMLSKENVSSIIIDELYRAFYTLEVSPYVRARAIERSISPTIEGKRFSRTVCAANILYESGEYYHALDLYIRALDEDEVKPLTMYTSSVCFIKCNRFNEGYDVLLKILKITDLIPGLYPCLIRCCLELGIEWHDYFKSMQIDKLNFNEIYELAKSLMEKEYFDDALYLYTYLLERYDGMDIYSMKMVCHSMSMVYRKLMDYKKGLETIYKIPDRFMDDVLYIDLGCIYYDSGELDKAEEAFRKGLKYSDSFTALFDIAILYMKREKYDMAFDYFKDYIENLSRMTNRRQLSSNMEYMPPLVKVYKNMAICCLKLGKLNDAILYMDKASKSGQDDSLHDALLAIQSAMLDPDSTHTDTAHIMDSCLEVREDFICRLKMFLDKVICKYYGNLKALIPTTELSKNLNKFISGEREAYLKGKHSIEHSDETFQRYTNMLASSFERNLPSMSEVACACEYTAKGGILDHVRYLSSVGENMLGELEYTEHSGLIYCSLIPYFKAVDALSHYILYPYYKRNINKLPLPLKSEGYSNIGVYSYSAYGKRCFRMQSQLDISSDEYLFEINCHPGLRKKYLDYTTHYMPWSKLSWMISGMKNGSDILDGSKSAGLLLLFYCVYKNYLGIKGDFKDKSEIVKLSGELIHLGNERDFCIKVLMSKSFEPDYVLHAKYVRDLALNCINDLMKIKVLK